MVPQKVLLTGGKPKPTLYSLARRGQARIREGLIRVRPGVSVLDALAPPGVRHADMPLTPANVWSAIQGQPVRSDLAIT